MPSYGGDLIFGRSPIIHMEPNPSRKQYAEFFGLNGVYMLRGGSRGRVFLCSGLLWGEDEAGLASALGIFQSYDDGIARPLVDTLFQTWPQVVYDRFQPGERIVTGHGGLLLDYKATFVGLI
jgi:hypothetical protein